MTVAVYRLSLLGGPVLQRGGGAVRGRAAYRRRMALLALLASARGRPVGRERIIGLLWPEQSGDSARHILSESLYVLRKELGDEAFVSVGDELALNPEVVGSDVADFQLALEEGRLEEAAALYQGPFLDGFYVADAPEFERWAERERDRLARGYARVLELLAEGAEDAGDHLAAAEWWRRLGTHDPFSSRIALRLMRALDAAGERTAALRFADAHALLLREELGVEPGAEVTELARRIRAEASRRPEPPPLAEADPGVDVEPEASAEEPAADRSGAEAPAGSAVDAVEDPRPGPPPSPDAPPAPARARGSRWRAAAYAGAVAALAMVLLALVSAARGGEEEPPRYDPHRIAVLYLEDYSPGGELQYLANGLTEMLIHELAQVEALEVVSRNGVRMYRERAVPFDSMVASLRAGSVVEGSLQRSGDSVRVTVQLIDANTGAHLESRVLAHRMGDLFALEDALADEVSGFLRRRLGQEVRLRQASAETRSAAALELVLRAAQAREQAARLAQQQHPMDAPARVRLLREADALLARAEAADPRWSRAAVERGWVQLLLGLRLGGAEEAALLDSARARAGRVLAREPGNARALELRGRAGWHRAVLAPGPGQEARVAAAERDLRAAVAAEPSLGSAWGTLSQIHLSRGRFAEAELAARRALAEDAWLEDADEILQRLYFGALAVGDLRAAGDACGRGREMFAADWRFVECRLTLLREDQAARPDPALAWRLVAELERLDPPARARAAGRGYAPIYRKVVAAAVSARAGQGDSARAVVARAREEVEGDAEATLALAYDEAIVRVLLGEREAARELLDGYLAARPALREYVARDPFFRDLLEPAPGVTR